MLALEDRKLKRAKEQDADSAEDADGDDKPTGVMNAMHNNIDNSELFALFSALGGRQSNNASATNRNPLPRGRACEGVDWLTELFKFLAPTSSSIGVASVRAPPTLVFRHSKPHTWYTSRKGYAGIFESAANPESDEVVGRLVRASEAEAEMVGLGGQVDVVAMYCSTSKPAGGGRPRTRIEYFDEGLLRDFMKFRPTKPDGILQLFHIPTGSKATCVRARYVQGRISVETRTNSYYITDTKHTVIERATTFDGEEHCSRVGSVPPASALFQAVSRQLREILGHVDTCIGDAYGIAEATAFFRVHADTKLYLLFVPSVLLCHSATQMLIHPENQPESPRAAKPVLVYAGSLPKDYFRCPCCGKVVAASEKARVPYNMMLQHIQKLDEADGVSDGDSAALRSIAAILDKVGRNPQYYAALYRAAAKSNPQEDTISQLRTCGYPGGDLELDDELENPAEVICFRLLQLAVAGGRREGDGLQLSIAHYKWIRDHRPKILHRISVFVCTDCSLGISNTAFNNQSRAFSQLGPGKADVAEAGQAAVAGADAKAGDGGGKGGGGRARRDHEEAYVEEPSPSLVDNHIRKTLSLPLLKPKLDRRAAASTRPWRQSADGDQLSEAPRFKPIGALKGEMPKPDPRFIPHLQYKQEEEEKRARRKTGRGFVAPVPKPQAHATTEDGGGGFFLTQSGSVPVLPTRRGGGAGQPPRRLPRVGGAASDAALNAISDMAAGQAALDEKIGALNERMARLEGTLGPASKRAKKKNDLLARGLVPDEKVAAKMAEIRQVLLKNMPRIIDLFRRFDKNGDGLVSRLEFRQVLPILNVPNFGNAEMDAVFDSMDLDGSGTVELNEMQKLLRKGADITLAASLQDGAQGEIEVEARNKYHLRKDKREGDLQAALKDVSVRELTAALVAGAGRVSDLFRTFDMNGDGTVTKGEFRAVLPLLGFDASKTAACDAVFDEIDAAGKKDGAIEYGELEAALRRDDIELAAELRVGAVAFDREAKNAFELRTTARDSSQIYQREASKASISAALKVNLGRVTDFFRQLDMDRNGHVTKEEFRQALPLLGFGAGGQPAIDALFDSFDVSGDGVLQYEELEAQLSAGTRTSPGKIKHAPAQGSFGHLF